MKRSAALLLAVVTGAAVGCQGGGETREARSPLEEGITLRDLPSYEPPEPGEDAQSNATPAPTPTISEKLVSRRLVFDRPSQKLAMALSMVDQEALSPEQRRLWRDNGFGIGRLDRSRLKLFMANVPQPRAVDVFRITNPASYRPVTLVRQNNGADRIRLVRPDRPPKLIHRAAGKYQLLMKLLPPIDPDEDATSIDLLPHHYKDLPSLLPQSPNESFLEGRSFEALRVEEPIDPDRIWVIWVREPPDPQRSDGAEDGTAEDGAAEEEAGASDEGGDGDSPTSGSTQASGGRGDGSDDGSVSLAEAMLSGMRSDDPVQIVLLVGVRR